MEIRTSKSKSKATEIERVDTEHKPIVRSGNKIIDVEQSTKAAKTIGFLESLKNGVQRFADWAATTNAGNQSRNLDAVFGTPSEVGTGNDDLLMMGLPENTPEKPRRNKKRRK